MYPSKRGAIYLRNSIPIKTLSASDQNVGGIECLFLEIGVSGVKAVLRVVYCPPAVHFVVSIAAVLDRLVTDYTYNHG